MIGLIQARGDVTYQQGLNKLWSRSTRYDFSWPKLQELGEQAILNKEIYIQGTSADNNIYRDWETGFRSRYSPPAIVTGKHWETVSSHDVSQSRY